MRYKLHDAGLRTWAECPNSILVLYLITYIFHNVI